MALDDSGSAEAGRSAEHPSPGGPDQADTGQPDTAGATWQTTASQPGAYPPGAYPPGAYAQPGGYPPPQGGYSPPPGGYPPPQGGYSPPPGAYPPPASYPPPAGYAQPPYGTAARPTSSGARQLTRSRGDRIIGGVCGGLARYWNTDATLLRILTVVLTLVTGGALIIGYLIAWVVIRDEPVADSGPFGQSTDTVGYASGGNPGYADFASDYQPSAPRERSYLGWTALSLAVLAAGALGLLGFLVPASVGIWGVILGVALAILGIGMLVGTRYGRARWLLWLAIPLAFVTVGTVQASNFVRDNPDWQRWTATSDADGWGGLTIGDRTWRVEPGDVADSPLDYQLSAGSAVLDLTGLSTQAEAPNADAESVAIDAGVGLGELIVVVPSDMRVDLDATVNVGQIKVPGARVADGTDLDLQTTIDPIAGEEPAYVVTLDAAIGAGSLEVRREAA